MIIDAEALKAIVEQETAAILAGEDLLDTAAGESTLSPDTVALLTAKRNYSIARKQWAIEELALYGRGLDFLDRKVFDIAPEIAAEIQARLDAMLSFANEFRPVVIGADAVIVSEGPAAK